MHWLLYDNGLHHERVNEKLHFLGSELCEYDVKSCTIVTVLHRVIRNLSLEICDFKNVTLLRNKEVHKSQQLGYIFKENLHQKSFLKLISLISLEKSQTYFIHKMHWWILCYLTMVQSVLGKMSLGKKPPWKIVPLKFFWEFFLISSFFYENFVHKKNLFSFN